MIEVDGKTYRNLPEQVEENANNIQWLLNTIQSFGNVMRYCGSVATYADLPTEDNRVGDVYNVLDTGNNYAWDGEAWDEISSIVDLSGYVTKIGCPLPYYEFDSSTDDIMLYCREHPEFTNKIVQIVRTDANQNCPLIACFSTNEDQVGWHIIDFNNAEHYSAFSDLYSVQTLSDLMVAEFEFDYFTRAEAQHMANKWVGAYVGDETAFTSEMAVGDIVVESTGGQFLINEITFSGGSLSKVVLVGLEDNGNPVVHTFESGAWSSQDYDPAKHLQNTINPNSNGFGLTLPSTATLAANEEIATEKSFPFKVIPVPSSSTLSVDEWNLLMNFGFAVDGNYLGLHNPIFFQGMGFYGTFYGIVIGRDRLNQFTKIMCWTGTGGHVITLHDANIELGDGYLQSKMKLDNVSYFNKKEVDGTLLYATLDSANIGAITTTTIATGWYRNGIAISSGLTDAVDVKVKMSNGAIYPAIINNATELVIFSGTDFQTSGLSVTAVYYKNL